MEVEFIERVWETGIDGRGRFGKQSGKHWSPHFRTSPYGQDIWGFMKDKPGSAKDDISVCLLQTSNLMSSSCRLPMRSVIGSVMSPDIMTAECSSSYGLDLVNFGVGRGVDLETGGRGSLI